MRVSVCMGVFNGIRFIGEQLDCIRRQTMTPDEVILCDDGSTDGTREFLIQYCKEHSDTGGWKVVFQKENKGFPKNYYDAMSRCSGDVVFLADQDDIWDLRKIARMCQVMEENPKIRLLGCTFGLIDGQDETIHTLMAPAPQAGGGKLRKVSAGEVFYKCEWPGMVLAYRNGWYREKVAACNRQEYEKAAGHIPHDFLLCARAAEEDGFFQLPERLAYHRRHENNAGGEEHRIGRLLKKERKQREIEEYSHILDWFAAGNIMQTTEGKEALFRKREAMKARYDALMSGKFYNVIRNAWKYRKEVRPATLVCDLFIVKQR